MIGLSRIGDADGGVTLEKRPEIDLLETAREAVKFLRRKVTSADFA